MRRSAAVSFVTAIKHHDFASEIFAVSDTLINDADDMVQKGYGWALKELGGKDPQVVYDFVAARVDHMSRTAYRYAIEKFPVDMRKQAMSL
jgi:3-methyladenine DNA glycosylase AlkD